VVYMLSASKLTASALTGSWCVPPCFTGTILMVCSKAKLKSNSNKAFAYFRPVCYICTYKS
jgi:hypothetical protein